MNQKLKILHLEDTPSDAEQVKRELKRGDLDFEIKVVAQKPDFIKALHEFSPDVILSDHSLPSFNSFGALEILKKSGKKTPFILVTATVSEEVAVELIKAGADDYILKDRLQRLPGAIVNILEKRHLENERQEYLKQVIISEAAFKEAERIAHFGTWNVDLISGATFWSNETFRILGYEPGEVEPTQENFRMSLHPDDKQRTIELTTMAMSKGDSLDMEFRVQDKNGSVRYVNSQFEVECDRQGKPIKVSGFNQDITEKKKAEQKLDKANHELTRVLDSVEECLYSLDPITWQFIHISNACEKIYGYAAEEFYANGRLWYEVIHTGDKYIVDETNEKLYKGQPGNPKFRIFHKNGTIRWLEGKLIPTLDGKGQLIHLDGVVKDITERKNAEDAIRESEERYRLISENPTLGITWSIDGKLIQVNKAFCSMLGYREAELLGMHYKEYSYAEDLDMPRVQKIYSGELDNYRCEKRYIKKDKTFLWGELNLTPVRDNSGTVKYVIAVVQDIMARKEAETQLKALNESLEKIVAERTAELQAANKDLEAFSYTVSHDLRTPVRAIQIFGSLLQKKFKEQEDDEVKSFMTNIMKCTVEMNDLINDLLTFSKLGKHDLVKSNVNMQQMVNEIKEYIINTTEEKKVELIIDGALPPVAADKTLLRSVWLNLLTNAVKYSRKDVPCKIQVSSRLENGHAVYMVKDNGTGFDMQYYNKLFKPFSRLHSSSEYSGTGAGLAICDSIIKKHGGNIWAESSLNNGSTFYFSLPLVKTST